MLHSILALLRSRRGNTTATGSAFAAMYFGMAALGTDVGLWYLSLRNVQTAADAAAMAAAATHTRYGQTSALAAGTQVASANGYTHGTAGATVTVNTPPPSGTLANVPGAYEVVITQSQPSFLSRLVTDNVPLIRARGVSAPVYHGPACVLALGGAGSTGLNMGGSGATVSPTCVFASNLTGATSIERYGSASVDIASFQSVGGCYGCIGPEVVLRGPLREYAPPTQNPFAHLDQITQPTRATLDCRQPPVVNGQSLTLAPSIPAGGTIPTRPIAYCSDSSNRNTVFNMNFGDTLHLQPGIYYFHNTSFIMTGGSVSCPTCVMGSTGVTLVFTGEPDRIGTISINGGADFRLWTSATQPDNRYNGVLVYRDIRASNQNGNPYQTNINGGGNSIIGGGLYFPSSDILYNGSSSTAGLTTSCTILVARSVDFSGTLTDQGCAGFGTSPSVTYAIRLVE